MNRHITDDLRAYAIAQRQATGASNAGDLFDHAAEVIDSRDAEIGRIRQAVRDYLNGAPLDEHGRFKDPSREVLFRALGANESR